MGEDGSLRPRRGRPLSWTAGARGGRRTGRSGRARSGGGRRGRRHARRVLVDRRTSAEVADVLECLARSGWEGCRRALRHEVQREDHAILLVVIRGVPLSGLAVDLPDHLDLLALVPAERARVAVAPALLSWLGRRAGPRVDRAARQTPSAVAEEFPDGRISTGLGAHKGVGVDEAITVRVDTGVVGGAGCPGGLLEGGRVGEPLAAHADAHERVPMVARSTGSLVGHTRSARAGVVAAGEHHRDDTQDHHDRDEGIPTERTAPPPSRLSIPRTDPGTLIAGTGPGLGHGGSQATR